MRQGTGWVHQWDRILRWRERVPVGQDEGRSDDLGTERYRDEVFALVQAIWHLKDWLSNNEEGGDKRVRPGGPRPQRGREHESCSRGHSAATAHWPDALGSGGRGHVYGEDVVGAWVQVLRTRS